MKASRFLGILVAVLMLGIGSAKASIIFDDFNSNEGHFNQLPTFSSTTNFTTASTADRITTDSIEGTGSESLVLVHSTATTNRVRFVSGSGTPSNNVSFNVSTAGTDGRIGYYYKVVGTTANAVGTTMSIILDDAALNTGASDDGGTPRAINADGQWHLVEWDLDNTADWGVVTGIGGDGVLGDTSRTIDSIYLQLNSAASGASFSILIDFVAKSDSGSISALLPPVPEPASISLVLLGVPLFLRRRR